MVSRRMLHLSQNYLLKLLCENGYVWTSLLLGVPRCLSSRLLAPSAIGPSCGRLSNKLVVECASRGSGLIRGVTAR